MNEERRLHKKVCNVSYPFFKAKAKVEAGAGWRSLEEAQRAREGTRVGLEGGRSAGAPKYISFFLP